MRGIALYRNHYSNLLHDKVVSHSLGQTYARGDICFRRYARKQHPSSFQTEFRWTDDESYNTNIKIDIILQHKFKENDFRKVFMWSLINADDSWFDLWIVISDSWIESDRHLTGDPQPYKLDNHYVIIKIDNRTITKIFWCSFLTILSILSNILFYLEVGGKITYLYFKVI